jgi:hypothetical protein
MNLLDQTENLVATVSFESDQNYSLNDQVRIPDGGLYVITAVRSAEPQTVDLTGIWIDGPHPTARLG